MMRISGILTTKGLTPRKTTSGSRSVNSTNDSCKINQDRIVFGLEGSRKAGSDLLQSVSTLKSFFMPLTRHEKGEQKPLQQGGTYAYVQLTAFRKIRKNFQSALDRSAKPCYFTRNGLETPNTRKRQPLSVTGGAIPEYFLRKSLLGLQGRSNPGTTYGVCFNPASLLFCPETAEKNNSNLTVRRQNDVFNRTVFRKIRKNFQSALDRSAKPCYFTRNGLETPNIHRRQPLSVTGGAIPEYFLRKSLFGLQGRSNPGTTYDVCFNPASLLFCPETAEKNNSNLIIGRQNDVFNRTTSDDRRRTESPAFRPAWSFNLYVTSGGIARHEASPEPETEYGGSPAAPADRINRNTDPRTEHRQNLIPKRRLPSLTEFCSKTTP